MTSTSTKHSAPLTFISNNKDIETSSNDCNINQNKPPSTAFSNHDNDIDERTSDKAEQNNHISNDMLSNTAEGTVEIIDLTVDSNETIKISDTHPIENDHSCSNLFQEEDSELIIVSRCNLLSNHTEDSSKSVSLRKQHEINHVDIDNLPVLEDDEKVEENDDVIIEEEDVVITSVKRGPLSNLHTPTSFLPLSTTTQQHNPSSVTFLPGNNNSQYNHSGGFLGTDQRTFASLYHVLFHNDEGNSTKTASNVDSIKYDMAVDMIQQNRAKALEALLSEQRKSTESLDDSTLKSGSEKKVVVKCTICLAEAEEDTQLSSTICGHIFCDECIEQCMKTNKRCPVCRKSLKGKNAIHKLYLS